MRGRRWTEEEFIVVFNLYLTLPFGQMDSRTPKVIQMAKLLDRTPSSIAMRLVNFASVDPFHKKRGVEGLKGGKKLCEPYFQKYINDRENLMFESEKILAKLEGKQIEDKFIDELPDISNYEGLTKERVVKTRVNQHLFRKIILANYYSKCAISDIDIPTLLFASHIKPWSVDVENRLNPSNGICLNALYDRAFDKGFIGFSNDYSVLFAEKLKKEYKKEYFKKYFEPIEGRKLNLPSKFSPDPNFLEYHLEFCFNK